MAQKKKKSKKKPLKKKAIKRKAIKRPVKRKAAKKRVIKKRPVKKQAKIKAAAAKKIKENVIGKVTHYFPKVRAAVVKLKTAISIGEVIKIKGHTTDFKQAVTSMQIDRVPLSAAKKGQEIGLLVDSRVRRHDVVSKA